ncbi:MAG: hypothetical protein RL528_1517 [Bacteroidota bacterium]|jgi:uncharacterized repeat protein (TIGR01451 family)
MKTIIPLLLCVLSFNAFSQLPTLTIASTSTYSGCNPTIDGSISIGTINSSNTSEIDMVLSPNQTTSTSIVLVISWGDGSTSTHQGGTNFGAIGETMTITPAIQHTYITYGAYLVTIQYSINNAGSQGTLSYIYNYNCGGPNTSSFNAFAIVNCNGVTTEILDSIPIIITNANGISYSSIINNGWAAVTLPIAGTVNQYTVTIDSTWLQNNNYAVTGSPSIINYTPNGWNSIQFNLICTGVQNCETSIVQSFNAASGALIYSSSTPSQINAFAWSISRFDAIGNQIGTESISTQANAYLIIDSTTSYVTACLIAVFNSGCIDSICETFNFDNCISGTIFCDANGNNMQDSSETTISNAAIQIQVGGTLQTVYSNINGYYSYTYSSNSPIILNLNPNWLSALGYTSNLGVWTLLSQDCDSNQTFNIGINCGSGNTQVSLCYSGIVFCDANGNGLMENSELPLSGAPIMLFGSTSAVGSGNNIIVYSDSSGYFTYCGPISGGLNMPPISSIIASVSPQWLSANGYSMNQTYIFLYGSTTIPNPVMFPVNCGGTSSTCADLWTTVTPWIGYYQGTVATVKLNWGNYGPGSPGSYTLTLTYPAGVTVNTSSIQNSSYTITGNTITWTLNSALSSFNNYDNITFNVPSGLPSGTPHYFTSTITPTGNLTDCSSLNNAGSLLQLLGNSYDPNDKVVSRPNQTEEVFWNETTYLDAYNIEKLNYTIRFQNTGTAPAQNIYIIDTLSSNLNWASFSLIESSHPMQVVSLGNGILRFEFSQIWLADSTTNEEASHGHLVYNISEKESTLGEVGAEIENTAYIYFDWNDPIVTNTTYNINELTEGIEEESRQFIKLFPNPAVSELNLVCGGEFNYEISDMSGRILLQGEINESDKIRIADLNAGVYNITCITENKVQTLRFMKQ